MDLTLNRFAKKASYTIGNLYIDGKFFCNTLEDTDRGLDNSMDINKIKELKKPSITAIPKGVYNITLDVYSPKFGSQVFYKEVCKGKLPRLLNVKGFDGILIHAGNTNKDTSGCILVGMNTIKGQVTESKATFRELYKLIRDRYNKGDTITIKIL